MARLSAYEKAVLKERPSLQGELVFNDLWPDEVLLYIIKLNGKDTFLPMIDSSKQLIQGSSQ